MPQDRRALLSRDLLELFPPVLRVGKIVVAPADTPHRFTNTGADSLRLTAIHPANEIVTDWLG